MNLEYEKMMKICHSWSNKWNKAAEAKIGILRKVVSSEHLGLGQHITCTKLRVSFEF